MLKRIGMALLGWVLVPGPALAQTAPAGSGTPTSTVNTGAAAGTTETTTPPSTPPAGTGTSSPTPEAGAFATLSPGNQKIAQSLFAAQVTKAPASTTTGGATSPGARTSSPTGPSTGSTLSLDQIAAMKQAGQGWGQIFHQMKAEGLVEAKNLGEVIIQHQKQPTTGTPAPSPGATAASTSVTVDQ
jgi:hypothetical protein